MNCSVNAKNQPIREVAMNSVVRHVGESSRHGVAVEDFRDAMRDLAAGVSIVTVGRGDDISGMTVTSVSSLSVDPATVIVSINRQTSSWPLLQKHGVFGINVLGLEHREISERFSGKDGLSGAARFAGAEWIQLASGVPLLAGALVAFDCEVDHVVERHSHAIVIGRVLDLRVSSGSPALVYWQRQYLTLDRDVPQKKVPTARALWQI